MTGYVLTEDHAKFIMKNIWLRIPWIMHLMNTSMVIIFKKSSKVLIDIYFWGLHNV